MSQDALVYMLYCIRPIYCQIPMHFGVTRSTKSRRGSLQLSLGSLSLRSLQLGQFHSMKAGNGILALSPCDKILKVEKSNQWMPNQWITRHNMYSLLIGVLYSDTKPYLYVCLGNWDSILRTNLISNNLDQTFPDHIGISHMETVPPNAVIFIKHCVQSYQYLFMRKLIKIRRIFSAYWGVTTLWDQPCKKLMGCTYP